VVEVPVWLEIDSRSGVPIYLQVVAGVRHAVEVGTLDAGDRLPTVRQLAAEESIAPNTIVKAYGELRRMGLVESRPGVGTVISGSSGERGRERRVAALEDRLRTLVRDAVGLGLTEDELWSLVDREFERLREGSSGG
jgi:GntR family transcriptional regulator